MVVLPAKIGQRGLTGSGYGVGLEGGANSRPHPLLVKSLLLGGKELSDPENAQGVRQSEVEHSCCAPRGTADGQGKELVGEDGHHVESKARGLLEVVQSYCFDVADHPTLPVLKG